MTDGAVAPGMIAPEDCQTMAEVVGDIWERLVEGSIAFECERWDERRALP